jgi:hypothetical protein
VVTNVSEQSTACTFRIEDGGNHIRKELNVIFQNTSVFIITVVNSSILVILITLSWY